jgi:hypothetical protein
LTDRTEEVPPPPEEVPPERAGEIPTAEEVPPPRTEEVPRAEEIPSGTPPQAPPGDVQTETSPEPPSRAEEAPPPDRGRAEEREEKGLLDRAMEALRGREEEPRREESERREPRGDDHQRDGRYPGSDRAAKKAGACSPGLRSSAAIRADPATAAGR